MVSRGKSAVIGVFSPGLIGLALTAPASAQGIFERIFGGLRHVVEAPHAPINITAFADPLTSLGNAINPQQQRPDNGPGRAYCVRSCDGHFFPVPAHAGMSYERGRVVQRVLHGQKDASVFGQLHRQCGDERRQPLCRSQQRLRLSQATGSRLHLQWPRCIWPARMDVKADPTLRPGDVVAAKRGLVAFTGTKNSVANFMPIDNYRGLSKTSRGKLAEVKIMPPNTSTAEVTTATITSISDRARNDDRAQASR